MNSKRNSSPTTSSQEEADDFWQSVQTMVDAAHDVVDDSIHFTAAKSEQEQSHTAKSKSPTVNELLDRLGIAVTEVGSLSVELARKLLESISDKKHIGHEAYHPHSIPVEIESHQHTKSIAVLHRIPVNGLIVTPLVHSDRKNSIDNVSIKTGPVLHVVVPENTPTGLFYGLILENDTLEAAGTISLKVVSCRADD